MQIFHSIKSSFAYPFVSFFDDPLGLKEIYYDDTNEQELQKDILSEWLVWSQAELGEERELVVARLQYVFENMLSVLDLSGFSQITSLPHRLPTFVKKVDLSGCSSLKNLPNTLFDTVQCLNLQGCTAVESLSDLLLRHGAKCIKKGKGSLYDYLPPLSPQDKIMIMLHAGRMSKEDFANDFARLTKKGDLANYAPVFLNVFDKMYLL